MPVLSRAICVASLALAATLCEAQYGAFMFHYPYDGANGPLDYSKTAIGATPAEACAKRTPFEITGVTNPNNPVVYVGLLPGGSCGYIWLNNVNGQSFPIDAPMIRPQFRFCADFNGGAPDLPRPPLCQLDCPADQKDPATGLCRISTPKNAGLPCPACANPIHPGTGNKFQAETDLPSSGNRLGLARRYNSGRPSHENVFGGFWLHTYQSKVMVSAPATNATVYRNDGKQHSFTLQGASWSGDSDLADTLTELKNAQGQRTGWRYRVAATDDIEHYDAYGRLTVIQGRSGMAQTLTYSDGTNGAVTGNGGVFHDAAGNPTNVDLAKDLLLRVRDHFGRALTFAYDGSRRIVKVVDPAGGVYLYGYAAAGNGLHNLVSVTYPDGRQRLFHYNEPANTAGTNKPNALTGITDENGARFATYRYDTVGRAIESLHHSGTGDVERHQLSYGVSGVQTSVTDPRGTARAYGFQTTLGVVKNTAVDQPAPGLLGSALAYDVNGNISSRTDFNGNRTTYTYDLARNLETSRTEGLTSAGGSTPQTRTISTQWHSSFRLPTGIAEPLRITTNAYDADGAACGARGALCSRTVQATTDANGAQGFSASAAGAPRTWTYTYNANGSVVSINGPRTDVADVTAYTYYANNDADLNKRGNVSSISNALGHTTSITAYNAHGQPLTVIDSNGLTTTLVYDARQRLTSRTVGSEVTSYDYDGVGQLIKVTLPDGSFLNYDYDAAHRLTGISDNLGNSVTYTLDTMGNRTAEQVRDPSSTLAQTRSRQFNSLNRLFRELGAQNQTTEYAYDNQGNVTSVKDPLDKVTANQYDALNRLKQVTDPGLGVTQYGYNGLDALTSVSDPRSLVTGYAVDGLGNLNQQVSPDTGTTTNTYDAAGNLLTQTDAKGQVTTYAYDALNRVTLITFHDGSKQAYAYDTGANGIGRLTSITELDPASQQTNQTSYVYDLHGRVLTISTAHAGVIYNLGYAYDSAGRLSGLTYPSGRTVTYGFDALGRVSQVTTTKDSQSQVVVQNVEYHPFGGVRGYTLGNGQIYSRSIDLDGRIATYTLGSKTLGIGYDLASRIDFISELGVPVNTYGYDALDRLTSATTPGTAFTYGYDAVGNRTSRIVGSTTDIYTYSATSNRIATVGTRSFTFDANGSTTNDGNNTYGYDVRGRMVQATSVIGATNYRVNALGQRIRKTNSLGDTVFHYDTNGKLIAETGPGGGVKREFFYLGDIPVGVFQ